MMKSAQAPAAAPAPYSLAASLVLSCRLSPEQEAVLEASFQRAKNVDPVEMELLAAEMGVPEGDVQTWFTARLSAWRKEQGLGANLNGLV
ncbi:homeodomain-only protein [Frankliniella occidentalis]|uniref:Homeodomain-only protein n=1 Tax=Frankliniella occidentalis TaxID=133901 RepID=A0A6J1T0D0_FRAOC|nr:homeodomain-only protein [Frankliniella occidentalis]